LRICNISNKQKKNIKKIKIYLAYGAGLGDGLGGTVVTVVDGVVVVDVVDGVVVTVVDGVDVVDVDDGSVVTVVDGVDVVDVDDGSVVDVLLGGTVVVVVVVGAQYSLGVTAEFGTHTPISPARIKQPRSPQHSTVGLQPLHTGEHGCLLQVHSGWPLTQSPWPMCVKKASEGPPLGLLVGMDIKFPPVPIWQRSVF